MTDQPAPIFDKRLGFVLLIAVLAAVVPFLVAGGKSNIAWESSFDTATSAAKTTGRPMLIYFTASWCGPCQKMKKHVFPDKTVEKLLAESFVPVKVDLSDPGPDERSLGGRYGVRGIPTMIIADADGNVIDQRSGGLGAAEFVKWLELHTKRDNS